MALQNVEANITLDLYNHDTTPATVKAIQLDSETRYVAARLQNVGVQYDVDSEATVQLIVVRPDKVGVQITGTTFTYGDESSEYLGPYAELTQVALAVSGKMRGQFKITSGTQILRTEIFTINNGVALDASTDEWADEYDGYNLEEMATSIETNTADIATLEADVEQIKEDLNTTVMNYHPHDETITDAKLLATGYHNILTDWYTDLATEFGTSKYGNLQVWGYNGQKYQVIIFEDGSTFTRWVSRDGTNVGTWKAIKDNRRKGKYYAFGDSRTYGLIGGTSTQSAYRYPKYIADALTMSYANYAISGSGLFERTDTGKPAALTTIQSKDISDATLITIEYGINDWRNPIGTYEDTGDTTWCGKLYRVIQYISQIVPNATLVIIGSANTLEGTQATDYGYGYTTASGWSLGKLIDEEAKLCAKYHIPFISGYDSPLNNFILASHMSADTIHLDDEGHRMRSEYLLGKIISLPDNPFTNVLTELQSDVSDLKEELTDLQNEFDNAFIQEVPFDLVWSQGNISDSTGQPSGTTVGAIRTDALYDVSEQTKINVVYNNGTYPSSIVFTVYLYNETQTFLSKVGKYAGTHEIDVSTASYVRFKVARNDSVTEISPSDGNTLVQATKRDVAELASKPYVDGKVNPLIPVVENLSAQKVVKTVSLAWQKGKLSDSGNESQSSSTTFIRNVYAIPITAESVTLTVPSGFKADVHFYSYYATSNSTHYPTIQKNLTGTNTITVPTEYRYIRMVLTRSDGADISLSDGDLVILTYIDGDLGSASTSYVNLHPEYISLAMFEKIGVIGDSFASGTIYLNGGNTSEYNLSWPQVIGRKIGAEVTNYTEGGLSTKDWLTDADHGLPALLADNAKQLYILALGINDNTQINAGTLALGTLADITSDYTQNPESFYGNYGRIVGNILNHAPKAKIVILSIARPTERQMDTHLLAIAEKLGLPYIQLTDDSYFESGLFYGAMSGNHPLAYGYSGMANAIQRLLETGIANNTAYFADYTG